jgi:mannosyltransferase
MTSSTTGVDRPLQIRPDSAPFSTVDRWIACGLIALFVAIRLQHVVDFRVWFDEIFTLDVARRSWMGLLWYTKEYDVHPPLFYMTVKLWTALGGWSYGSLGLYSVVWMVAALVPFLLLSRQLGLTPTETNVALALMAVNGYLVGYGEEIRVYSLLFFLATLSLWLFARYCNDPRASFRAVLALGAVNFLIVYTEYFGWLVVGAEGLFLLLWNRRKLAAFAATVSIAVVLYLPWVYYVVEAVQRRVGSGQKALF